MVSIFRGDNFFLSNFYPTDIKWHKHVHKSAEHLYQAMKCSEISDRERIRNTETSKSAKILGKFIKIRPDWNEKKLQKMEYIVRLKFRKAGLKKLLRQTGDKELIDQNYFHDIFWGVCGCTRHQRTGLNHMGKILMKIRAENNEKLDKI